MRCTVRLIVAILSATQLIASSGDARAQNFHDDFNGSSLDPSSWQLELGDGSVVVSGGEAIFSGGGSTFPVATTINNPFPAGDFIITVGLRYVSVAWCGDGVGAVDNFHGEGCSPFKLWQDAGGWYVYSGSLGYLYLGPGPDTNYHIYQWSYMNGTMEFSRDGTTLLADNCAPRPTALFLGHPHPISCNPWTSFAVDFVDVRRFGVTSSRTTTWGRVKGFYR